MVFIFERKLPTVRPVHNMNYVRSVNHIASTAEVYSFTRLISNTQFRKEKPMSLSAISPSTSARGQTSIF